MFSKRNKSWWMIICVLAVAIIFSVLMRKITILNIGQDDLFGMADKLTEGYQLRQVIAVLLLFMSGRLFTSALIPKWSRGWKVVLAFPVANAVWGVVSAFLLFCGIPYNRVSIVIVFGAIHIGMLIWIRRKISGAKIMLLAKEGMVALSAAFVISTGIIPIFMSSDSYYYVMQYGELMVKAESLSMDVMGMFMTWTGVAPALMSALAVFGGFETIHVIHYFLILSMMAGTAVCVWEHASGHCSLRFSAFAAVGAVFMIMAIPAVALLSTWVISSTYFMVYMFFFLYLPTKMETGKTEDFGVVVILALFGSWMALSRAEACLIVCFLIVCMSSLNISKKQLLLIEGTVFLSQILFFIKVYAEWVNSSRHVSDRLLTGSTLSIMVVVMLAVFIYLLLYDTMLIGGIRKKINILLIGGLFIGCLGFALIDFEKFLNNISSLFYNLQYEFWGFFPWIALILGAVLIKMKRKLEYWDVVTAGYILFNFAVCMGRPQPLRLGFGDSFNRILIGIVPIFVISVIIRILQTMGEENVSNETE